MKMFKLLFIGLLMGIMMVPLVACEKKGPAEKAGEQVDQAVEETKEELGEFRDAIKDKLDPQGPAEEAGEKIDEAMEPAQ